MGVHADYRPTADTQGHRVTCQSDRNALRYKYVAQPALRIFTDQRTAKIDLARGWSPGCLGHHQCRGMESPRTDAANRPDAACRGIAGTRCSQLGMARIWESRWFLADAGGSGPVWDS